jgi:hypothetical protein
MRKVILAVMMMIVMLAAACGGGEEQASRSEAGNSDGNRDHPGESGGEEISGSAGGGDETTCRVTMESLAMMLLTVKGSRGSLPETLEEFQGISPAYAEMTVECGGTPYRYEVDGEDFTITCPNGHGHITNDQASWSW